MPQVLATSVEWRPPSTLKANPRNARTHSARQLKVLADAIKAFGFNVPILVDEEDNILSGHGRRLAAEALEMRHVPVLRVAGLTTAQKKAFVIAENRLADLAGWDDNALKLELSELVDLGFEVEVTGFGTAEIDVLLDGASPKPPAADDAPEELDPKANAVTRYGDLWLIGPHRLLCADATQAESYRRLLGNTHAQVVFTDPPYNVRVDGHASGLGKTRHREFAMASGEMSQPQFTQFLTTVMSHLAASSQRSSIHFICMDWRHTFELLTAGRGVYSDLKNICVWAKSNGGMGSLYRSQHEFVAVFQNGKGTPINNVALGATGRYRTNLWSYAGANAFRSGRTEDLEDHPTVKPVGLVADAIRDCSRRGGLVLDPFTGSGTTLLAAARTNRVAAGMELDPLYVDTAIRRLVRRLGVDVCLADSNETFEEVAARRLNSAPRPHGSRRK